MDADNTVPFVLASRSRGKVIVGETDVAGFDGGRERDWVKTVRGKVSPLERCKGRVAGEGASGGTEPGREKAAKGEVLRIWKESHVAAAAAEGG